MQFLKLVLINVESKLNPATTDLFEVDFLDQKMNVRFACEVDFLYTTERARDQNIVASYLSKFRPLCMGPHNVPGENLTNLAKEKNPQIIWLL